MNDLPDVVKSSLWEFADDTKLYHCIESPTDWFALKTDLDSFMDWCITWQSSVNIDKCKYMTIGGTSNRQYSVSTDYVQHCT